MPDVQKRYNIMAKMSVDDKLGLDLFHTDEHNPHITVNEDYDNMEEINKVLMGENIEEGELPDAEDTVYLPN